MNLEIRGGRTLLEDGMVDHATVRVENGTIVNLSSGQASTDSGFPGPVIDASDCFVLPGIVDFHGDAFERSLAPRESTRVAGPIAFRDVDAQLVSNGITTALVSPTLTWQKHRSLRNAEGASRVMDEFTAVRDQMRCDVLLHLRYEIHHVEGEPLVARWLEDGRVDLLAFNDHLNYFKERLESARAQTKLIKAFGKSHEELAETLGELEANKDQAYAAVERLAAIARDRQIPMCAHDEESVEQRRWYHGMGSRISEFPINDVTIQETLALGDDIVLGAPNLVKGASLYNRVSAREAVREGKCTILASDYYYPALLHAPFLAARLELCTLREAWKLVSTNPARALGLADRGSIAEGLRGDLIVVRELQDGTHEVVASVVKGKAVYLADLARVVAPQAVYAD